MDIGKINLNLDVNDLVGRLLNLLANCGGKLWEPINIRLLADADAYKQLKQIDVDSKRSVAESKTEVEVSRIYDAYQQEDVVKNLTQRERLELKNQSDVIRLAAEDLQNEEQSEESVSHENKQVGFEWGTSFFDKVATVDDEDLKVIWAKLLVAEIKSPGTIKKRTLEVLKNLEPDEARWFDEASAFVVDSYIPLFVLREHLFSYVHFLTLCDAGLISNAHSSISIGELEGLNSFSHKLVSDKEGLNYTDDGFVLTDAGEQILALAKHQTDLAFYEKIRDRVSKANSNKEYRIVERE
jgi:hypothetical protein